MNYCLFAYDDVSIRFNGKDDNVVLEFVLFMSYINQSSNSTRKRQPSYSGLSWLSRRVCQRLDQFVRTSKILNVFIENSCVTFSSDYDRIMIAECEKLFQLVTVGTKFTQENNIDVLENPVHMILLGHHEVISEEKHTWNSIIASSRYRFSDEIKLTKQPIDDSKLDEEMQKSSGPSVILYFVDKSQQVKLVN